MSAISWTSERVAFLRKQAHQHKYDHGHLLVLSGPRFRTGAARMAALAALRVGAGLVTLGGSQGAMKEMAPSLLEIMLTEIDRPQDLSARLERDQRIGTLCLGPALGLTDRAAGLVDVALRSGRSCVLDADALTLIAQNKVLRDALHKDCILTPHAGEFSRLCPDLPIGRSEDARQNAVHTAAEALGCVVLLKGAMTVIGSPDGQLSVLDSSQMQSAPWLATAGAGDVLAGLIAGLMARGAAPGAAAETGALLHVTAAADFGPGLIAGDVIAILPKVLAELGV
ncbi:MAG: NAD(P)H-hydrate dehydratase [Pseudomonadota bacterium]